MVANDRARPDLDRLGRRTLVKIADDVEAIVDHLAQSANASPVTDQHPGSGFDRRTAADLHSLADDDLAPALGVQLDRKIGCADAGAIPNLHLPTAMDPDAPMQPHVAPEAGPAVPDDPKHVRYRGQIE
jgi:hypothetical protein